MTKYASKTKVPVSQSKREIEDTLTRYGADQFMQGWRDTDAAVGFRLHGRMVRFVVPMPDASESGLEQKMRQRWRALLLVIKAKLEAVESGITEFDEEFMAHIVMPDGLTIAEHIGPQIASAYESGKLPPLLPHFGDDG